MDALDLKRINLRFHLLLPMTCLKQSHCLDETA